VDDLDTDTQIYSCGHGHVYAHSQLFLLATFVVLTVLHAVLLFHLPSRGLFSVISVGVTVFQSVPAHSQVSLTICQDGGDFFPHNKFCSDKVTYTEVRIYKCFMP
jgi:Trk-type K+ transport system membrane component